MSAWALVQIEPASSEVAQKVLPVLSAGLKDRAALARRGAAEALGSLGPAATASIPALQAAGNDKDPTVRAAAAKALDQIHGRKTPEK